MIATGFPEIVLIEIKRPDYNVSNSFPVGFLLYRLHHSIATWSLPFLAEAVRMLLSRPRGGKWEIIRRYAF